MYYDLINWPSGLPSPLTTPHISEVKLNRTDRWAETVRSQHVSPGRTRRPAGGDGHYVL